MEINNQKIVLIVDDDVELSNVLIEKLQQVGLGTLYAKDGKEGLKIAFESHPDIILLDMLMPKMNGLEMLIELRNDKWGKDVEVILLTVLDDVESLSQAMEEHSFEYLIKTDWKLDEIVGKIKSKLS